MAPTPSIDRAIVKEAIKEAHAEFLRDTFAAFGRWTFYSMCAAALSSAVYFILIANGWKK